MFTKSKLGTNLPSMNTLGKENVDLELTKRVSTITETLQEDEYDDSEEYSEDDGSDGSESDYEIHTHTVKVKTKSAHSAQLSTVMGYCGLGSFVSNTAQVREALNEELKRTFAVMDDDFKRLNNKDKYESIVGEYQIKLIRDLKAKLLLILDRNPECLANHCTLYKKYGVIKEVIGRGSYGIIKVIDSEPKAKDPKKKIYAVKELTKRSSAEPNNTFIERVLSEYIISASLNHKNIVKTVDFMATLPMTPSDSIKFSQVMECTPGGDLFSYITNNQQNSRMSLDEVDCFIKQIAKGLNYMHNHGVAHCDLKLENILISYTGETTDGGAQGGIVLKVTDFGKSNVFRTAFDNKEQYYEDGRLGSEPYMCPEEYLKKPYSLTKKDAWALGVIVLVLFNIRKHYYTGVTFDEEKEQYPCGYLWQTTETKFKKYKDKVFDEYSKNRMILDYDPKTKEWMVSKKGSFKPIQEMFLDTKEVESESEIVFSSKEIDDDLCELRRWTIYKLLDMDGGSRMDVGEFLKGDWMSSIEVCE